MFLFLGRLLFARVGGKTDQRIKKAWPYEAVKVCENCHQHFFTMPCRVILTECKADEGFTKGLTSYPLCKEMCGEVFEACKDCLEIGLGGAVHCDHLPSMYNDSFPCFHEPVNCGLPENTSDAYILNYNSTLAFGKASYSCFDSSKSMANGGTSRCTYSGKWSALEPCAAASGPDIIVIVSVSLSLFLLSVILGCICIYKMCIRIDKTISLTRIRDFDAVVFYAYVEGDEEFVRNILREELEVQCEPAFKLLIHGRDFKPGRDIKHNIRDAVHNSNSAIIIMSQDFVNSLWCRDEFEECYMENRKDPAFKIYVIMMQPKDELTNLTAYMESFFDSKTYLERGDEDLFDKLEKELTLTKTLKKDAGNDNVNLDTGYDNDIEEDETAL